MKYRFWQLDVFKDERGGLCAIEWKHLPFIAKRVYFLYDTKTLRGGHAHRNEKEVFVCVKGSFKARIHDGIRWHSYLMKTPGQALYTDKMVWHEFDDFTKDAVMLAISSTPYKGQKGYIMNLDEFKKLCCCSDVTSER